MGKVTGFMDFPRIAEENIPPAERVKNYNHQQYSSSSTRKKNHPLSPLLVVRLISSARTKKVQSKYR